MVERAPAPPASCIPLRAARDRLGPLLIGAGWIATRTPRELYLRKMPPQVCGDGFYLPIDFRNISAEARASLSPLNAERLAAFERDELARSQRDQCDEWLSERGLLYMAITGQAVVDESAFEAALVEAFGSAAQGRPGSRKADKGTVHEAAVEILGSGRIERKRGSHSKLVDELGRDFPGAKPDLLRRYSSDAHSRWRAAGSTKAEVR